MAISTITSKGQVTIPKKVREQLQLRTGDKLDFKVEGDGSLRVHPVAKRVSEVFGVFAHKAQKPLSTAQIKQRLREALQDGEL